MFWRVHTSSTSQVDTFLEKENVTLKELLELEDIIQECKNQNKKLVDYLTTGDILSNLIDLIIHEPPDDVDPSQRFKFANVAAELLSCEVPQVNEKISSDESLLDRLYSFLESNDAPLNPLLASFFSKAFGVLITRKSEQNWYSYQFTCLQVFEFLKQKEFVVHVLKHIRTSAISDLVIRLITCVEGANTKQGLLDWLNEKQLIESIIGLLNDGHDRDVHDNASRLLTEILRVSRDSQYMPANERCNDPLLAKLESPDTVELLLNNMFGAPKTDSEEGERRTPSQSVLVNGISILLALLENRKAVSLMDKGEGAGTQCPNYGSAQTFQSGAGEAGSSEPVLSAEELAQQQVILDLTIASIIPRLKDFTSLLTDPPNKDPIRTTAGVLEPPLGQARLHIAKLVSALLATNNATANQKLIELKTMDTLLDLFFQYSLNNFLHAQVESCIKNVFSIVVPHQISPNASHSTPDANTTPTDEEKNEMEEPKKDGEEAVVESEATPEPDPDKQVSIEEANGDGMDESPAPEKSDGEESSSNTAEVSTPEVKINPLLVHLYTDCHLVDRVLGAWELNDNEESEPGHSRKGYMAHLTRIANIMQINIDNKSNPTVASVMSELPESTRDRWSTFAAGKLADTNERNTIVPPQSYNSNNLSSSEDDDADFRDINFPQESALQQIYSEYQMQQMSDNLSDPYGFTEDDFNDNDDASAKRVLRFGLEDSSSSNKKQAQQDLFESFCQARFTCFPGDFDGDDKSKEDEDDEDEDDPWENKTCEITFGSSSKPPVQNSEDANLSPIKMSPAKTGQVQAIRDASSPSSADHVACSSSDEEENEKATTNANAMDVEEATDDFWTDEVPAGITPVDMDTGNPWDSTPVAAAEEPAEKALPVEPIVSQPWAEFNDTEMEAVSDAQEPAASEPLADGAVATGQNETVVATPPSEPTPT